MNIDPVLKSAKPLQIFFSRVEDLPGACIQLGEVGWDPRRWGDKTVPRHAGFLLPVYGQWFACEVTLRGPDLTPLDVYQKKNATILSTWEWAGFNFPENVEAECKDLALWIRRRKEKGYDWAGAISASPWVRKLCPWIKDDPVKDFCDESVIDRLHTWGAQFPLQWVGDGRDHHSPNPLEMLDWFKQHPHEYKQIYPS